MNSDNTIANPLVTMGASEEREISLKGAMPNHTKKKPTFDYP